VIYREAGQFKTSYAADQAIFPIRQDRVFIWLFMALILVGVPAFASDYLLTSVILPFLVLSIAAMGLNILLGYCGQISLGMAAFMAVGAFTAYKLTTGMPWLPLIPVFILSGVITAVIGMAFGLPSLRIKGFYLAVTTLAAHFFIEWVLTHFGWFTNYSSSGVISAPGMALLAFPPVLAVGLGAAALAIVAASVGRKDLRNWAITAAVVAFVVHVALDFAVSLAAHLGWMSLASTPGGLVLELPIRSPEAKYFLALGFVLALALAMKNIARSSLGRAFMAVRDRDVAAEVMGISMLKTKLLAFAISSFYCGVAGALWVFAYIGTVEPQAFDLNRAFQILFMVIIGGLGTVLGSFLGTAFVLVLPIAITNVASGFGAVMPAEVLSNLELIVFGSLIIIFLIVEPAGLARLWQIGKEKLRLWPFPY
jgi:branched-chain amino acid transport system permease protein